LAPATFVSNEQPSFLSTINPAVRGPPKQNAQLPATNPINNTAHRCPLLAAPLSLPTWRLYVVECTRKCASSGRPAVPGALAIGKGEEIEACMLYSVYGALVSVKAVRQAGWDRRGWIGSDRVGGVRDPGGRLALDTFCGSVFGACGSGECTCVGGQADG
jgi:hypothetical protein